MLNIISINVSYAINSLRKIRAAGGCLWIRENMVMEISGMRSRAGSAYLKSTGGYKMGADLILQDIAIRHKPTAAFWNKLGKALDKKVDEMSFKELKAWADEIGSYDDVEDLRIEAHGVIKTALDDLRHPCRDMTWITLPNNDGLITVYLAGGMSWGDTPGESYDELYKLSTLFNDYRFIDEVLEE